MSDCRSATPGRERLIALLQDGASSEPRAAAPVPPTLGVIEGTGIGPAVVGAALQVLSSVKQAMGLRFDVRHSPEDLGGLASWAEGSSNESLMEFSGEILEGGGAILNGPIGGRYVYGLRRRFGLFCKFVPVRPWPELSDATRIAASGLRDVDLLIVRDNAGGVYQGRGRDRTAAEGRVVEHSFSYSETQVRQLAEVAARAAARRRGRLHVIVKEGGVPEVSALWREVSLAAGRKHGVQVAVMNIDLAAYELIQHPAQFDVLVAPNLFGDILADIAGRIARLARNDILGQFQRPGPGRVSNQPRLRARTWRAPTPPIPPARSCRSPCCCGKVSACGMPPR